MQVVQEADAVEPQCAEAVVASPEAVLAVDAAVVSALADVVVVASPVEAVGSRGEVVHHADAVASAAEEGLKGLYYCEYGKNGRYGHMSFFRDLCTIVTAATQGWRGHVILR